MGSMVVAAVYKGGNLPTPDPLNHNAAAVASSPSATTKPPVSDGSSSSIASAPRSAWWACAHRSDNPGGCGGDDVLPRPAPRKLVQAA